MGNAWNVGNVHLNSSVSLRGSERCYHFNIPENAYKDSSECYRSIMVMLKKVPGTFPEGSKKCSTHLRPIFSKILVMVQAFKARLVLIFIHVFILFILCD